MENKLRELRARHRLTQEMLAQRVGVSRQTINAIENNKMTPSLKIGLKIASVLGYAVEDIFKLREEKPKASSIEEKFDAHRHGYL